MKCGQNSNMGVIDVYTSEVKNQTVECLLGSVRCVQHHCIGRKWRCVQPKEMMKVTPWISCFRRRLCNWPSQWQVLWPGIPFYCTLATEWFPPLWCRPPASLEVVCFVQWYLVRRIVKRKSPGDRNKTLGLKTDDLPLQRMLVRKAVSHSEDSLAEQSWSQLIYFLQISAVTDPALGMISPFSHTLLVGDSL